MTPIEDKLIEAWHEFKIHAQNMGYTNQQNINECLNGAGAFLDFLFGRHPRAVRPTPQQQDGQPREALAARAAWEALNKTA